MYNKKLQSENRTVSMNIYHLSCAPMPDLGRYDQHSVDAGLDHSLIPVSFFQSTTRNISPTYGFIVLLLTFYTISSFSILTFCHPYLFCVAHTILLHFTHTILSFFNQHAPHSFPSTTTHTRATWRQGGKLVFVVLSGVVWAFEKSLKWTGPTCNISHMW